MEGESTQVYNNYIHRVRENARRHIAQSGVLTTLSAGAWATTAKGRATTAQLKGIVDQMMPHNRMAHQFNNVNEHYLRLETEVIVHPIRFKEEHRTGETFFDTFLEPWILACVSPEWMAAFRKTTVYLHPNVSVFV